MPVEIEELVIRVVVGPDPGRQAGPSGDAKDTSAELVQLVADKVLEILRQKEER